MSRRDRKSPEQDVELFMSKLSPAERAELFGSVAAGEVIDSIKVNTNEASQIADLGIGNNPADPVEEL